MTLNSSYTNTTLSIITAGVHEKPTDTIEKESENNSKNDQNLVAKVDVGDDDLSFRTPRKIFTVSLHQFPKNF